MRNFLILDLLINMARKPRLPHFKILDTFIHLYPCVILTLPQQLL